MIHAIETFYKNYRFRSRLEARWAVFFDVLRIQWEYELEGFTFDDKNYLPDFYLPTFDGGMYCEVKPLGGDFSLAIQFARASKSSVWLCEGTPDYRAYNVATFVPEKYADVGFPEKYVLCLLTGIPNADQAQGENRMYTQPEYENDDLSIPQEYLRGLGTTFLTAVKAARSARFEHGEHP